VPVPPPRSAFPIGKPVEIKSPLGLPPVPFPPDNPPTAETIALGRKLFFDPVLSKDGTVACANCHDPKSGLTDPERFSKGVNGTLGSRHSMVVLNAVYHLTQFWDGRVITLEQQASRPVLDPLEMAHSLEGVERKVSANPAYTAMFARAWGEGRITYDMIAKSIASYERTLVSGNSPFDRYYYAGDKKALNTSAIRGLDLFMQNNLDAPNCVSCHQIGETSATFTENRFHNTGVAWDSKEGRMVDMGRYNVTNERKDIGAFKVPTLRNIELTAPYMHDGSMKTLEEVVDFYFDGGRKNPWLSGVMPHHGVPTIPKEHQAQAKKDLVELMKAFTGDIPGNAQPPK
jgi:cytochrome c peroxidase